MFYNSAIAIYIRSMDRNNLLYILGGWTKIINYCTISTILKISDLLD